MGGRQIVCHSFGGLGRRLFLMVLELKKTGAKNERKGNVSRISGKVSLNACLTGVSQYCVCALPDTILFCAQEAVQK